MATTPVAADPNTQLVTQPATNDNVTSEREDYVVGYDVETDKDGKVTNEPSFYSIGNEDNVKAVREFTEAGKFKPSFTITVSIPRAKNLAGVQAICPNEEEAAANFNRGAKQKANNRLKAMVLEVDADGKLKFDPASDTVNGLLDMTSEIASPSKRKVLTEEEKLDRFLEQFAPAMRDAMKAAYVASRT
jgi:hypothetical protein